MAALLFPSFAGASPGLVPPPNACWRIEINTFGDAKNPRTCFVFWGHDGEVMDWRWHDDGKAFWQDATGGWRMVWRESLGSNRLLHVIGGELVYTRTLHDVELRERDRWPDEKRRKLR